MWNSIGYITIMKSTNESLMHKCMYVYINSIINDYSLSYMYEQGEDSLTMVGCREKEHKFYYRYLWLY